MQIDPGSVAYLDGRLTLWDEVLKVKIYFKKELSGVMLERYQHAPDLQTMRTARKKNHFSVESQSLKMLAVFLRRLPSAKRTSGVFAQV